MQTAGVQPWTNRIVGHGEVNPEELLANPRNFRIHPGAQQDALSGTISDLGFIRSVTVNRRTGFVVDGHLRVELALSQGQRSIPVEYVDLSEAEEAEALATLDPLSAMAGTDKAKLDELLHEVKSGDSRVQQMLADLAAKSGLRYGLDETPTDEDADDLSEEDGVRLAREYGVESGQIWEMGNHRLIVGDCTDLGTVARLMEDEVCDMVLTDAPYGVAYVGKTKKALQIQNDALGDDGTRDLVADALRAAPMRPGASFYLFSPAGNTETAFRLAIMDAGLELRQCLVWVKQQFVMGRQDYHWRHESLLYGWKEGAAHYFVPDRTEDTVLQYDRPHASRQHPTTKPTALLEYLCGNSSRPQDIVYDGFLGSGSTILACENTGRRGRGVELDVRYAAVSISRWEELTGRKAVCAAAGEREDVA